ncbi:MAG: hypothetical protein AVDCRST_MAG75-1803 [uncultured Propionibacteriaceae bacterium]|uniref:Uncharacterized protein n=1 Tax=uncultured Propionibacteriaceae bacterium TaxID=257457 RepID=A0A6J4NRN3_9ACTN|nr:MAG: hypothetical protein AVDCRST_MAG75-1803 [uncultured Propionibacteriaceae bacterium]
MFADVGEHGSDVDSGQLGENITTRASIYTPFPAVRCCTLGARR